MAKVLFGLTLSISATIALATWVMGNIAIIQPGTVSSLLSGLRLTGAYPIAILLLMLVVVGFLIAIFSSKTIEHK